jgi:hypothetical protein
VNKKQKAILAEVVSIMLVTLIAVVGMINFKDYINRSEAISAMQQLSTIIVDYRKKNGRVPPEYLVTDAVRDLKGGVRLGELQYRGLWIDFDAEPNDILAYTQKNYPSSLLNDGYIILQIDGAVKWMGLDEFRGALAHRQSEVEIEMTRH